MTQQVRRVVLAFLDRRAAKHLSTWTDGTDLRLHGSRIAWWGTRGDVWISTCGFDTHLTRDRLNGVVDLFFKSNGLPGRSRFVCAKDGITYAGGVPWDGEPMELRIPSEVKLVSS